MEQTLKSEGTDSATPVAPEKYWDPIFSHLPADMMESCRLAREESAKKLKFYQAHPRRLLINLALLCLLTFLVWAIAYRWAAEGFMQLGILAALPPILYSFYVKSLEKSLLEELIAQRSGWLYDPKPSSVRWEMLASTYAEIFRKGDRGQEIGSQFWGRFEEDKAFWSGCFRYTVGSGKNSTTYTETVYAFHLPEEVAHSFVLRPQNLWRKLETSFTLGLTTEANEFNRFFHIDFEGDVGKEGAEVLQVLTPDAEEKLIAFRQEFGREFSLLFRGEAMVVSFAGDAGLLYTDFFKKVELDERDVERFLSKMTSILGLAEAILPCLR